MERFDNSYFSIHISFSDDKKPFHAYTQSAVKCRCRHVEYIRQCI